MSNDQYGTLSVQQMSNYGHEQWLQYGIENIDNISETLLPKNVYKLVLMLIKYNLRDTFVYL